MQLDHAWVACVQLTDVSRNVYVQKDCSVNPFVYTKTYPKI